MPQDYALIWSQDCTPAWRIFKRETEFTYGYLNIGLADYISYG